MPLVTVAEGGSRRLHPHAESRCFSRAYAIYRFLYSHAFSSEPRFISATTSASLFSFVFFASFTNSSIKKWVFESS